MKAMRKKAKGGLWLFYTKKFPKIEPHMKVNTVASCLTPFLLPQCSTSVCIPSRMCQTIVSPCLLSSVFFFFPVESLFPAAAY